MVGKAGRKGGSTAATKAKPQDGGRLAGPGLTSALVTLGQFLMFLVVLPPMLNYGGLKQEREYLEGQAVLYDIGFGQKMYLNCIGEGAPTIILDSPTGHTSDIWLSFQKLLGKVSQVCVYDRAGLGLSSPAPQFNMSDPGEGAVARTLGPQNTVIRMVSDLHRLVTFSRPLPRPLLLVGSEMGGLVARAFAHIHPQDIMGIVLIDPLSETLFADVSNVHDIEKSDNPWIGYWFHHLLLTFRLLQVSAMTGLSRIGILTGFISTPNFSDDADVVARLKHQLCDPFHIQAVIDEHSGVNASFQQMQELQTAWPLPSNITATILTGSHYDDQLAPILNRGWSRSVQDIIDRLAGSKHVVITGSDRHVIYKQPEELFQPVARLVKRWRSHQS